MIKTLLEDEAVRIALAWIVGVTGSVLGGGVAAVVTAALWRAFVS